MTQEQLEAYLGRSLTAIEVTNRKKYLKIAHESLESLLCASTEQVTETRTFDTRDGYRTVFTGFFTDITEVKIDGNVIAPEDYSKRQWDNRNASWYNSIVFKTTRGRCEVEITADWGFECLPVDLELLKAKLFSLVSVNNTTNSSVASKQTEDFRVTYRDTTVDDQFLLDNASVISKYSLCNIGEVRSGEICRIYYRNGYGLL